MKRSIIRRRAKGFVINSETFAKNEVRHSQTRLAIKRSERITIFQIGEEEEIFGRIN